MGCQGSLDDRNSLKGAECKSVCTINGCDLRRAPTIEEPRENHLLRVIAYVWSETIDCTAKVTVGAQNNIRGCHEGSQPE